MVFSSIYLSGNSLLNTEIARRSGRAYVFTPILWDIYAKDDYVEVTDNHLPDSQKIRPARVPLGAFIESPTSGAPWPDGDPTPRSVSYVWYERICPPEKQLRIDIGKVNEEIGVDLKKDQGIIIMDKWAMYLRNLEAKCVNLDGSRIIDFGCVEVTFTPTVIFKILCFLLLLLLCGRCFWQVDGLSPYIVHVAFVLFISRLDIFQVVTDNKRRSGKESPAIGLLNEPR